MKIYYDNIIFSLQKAGGISIYFYELLKRVNKDNCIFLKSGEENNIFYEKLNLEKQEINLKRKLPLSISRYFNVNILLDEKSIFHSSYYRTCKSKNAINITTVHDFTYEKYSKGIKKWIHHFQKKKAVLNSNGIICVSENTKKDLLKYIPKAAKKNIAVIYNGVSEEFFPIKNDETELFRILSSEEYIVYVGDRSSYKNFNIAIAVLSELKSYKLLIVGGPPLCDQERKKLNDALRGNYEHLRGVSIEDLNRIYNNAFCLLYPSSYEGFGIPIIEAMKAGCPVVAAKISSIPEVAGNAGLLVERIETSTFVSQIKVLENVEIRKTYIEKGILQATKFSWDKMYLEQINFYKKMIKI